MDRFEFQRQVANKYSPGTILNIGCNEDPAGLAAVPGVVNIDAYTNNAGRPYPVDLVFDCTIKPWPLEDASAEVAIFGDIIEHLYPEELEVTLQETFRVAKNFCATIPRDDRILQDPEYYEKIKGVDKGVVHVHVYEETELRMMLGNSGFTVERFDIVDYGFVPVGYLIEARRA
jgi:hypothetical protein